jgi:glutathione peroxidase
MLSILTACKGYTMRNTLIVLLILLLPFAAKAQNNTKLPLSTHVSAYQFSFEDPSGRKISLADYKDKVILIVNTASQCGFAGQFLGLRALQGKYQNKGLIIIAVPSDDFGKQEPLDNSQIQSTIQKRYNATFIFTAKAHVKGQKAHPFYKWASLQNKGNFLSKIPRWNFHKYLIGRNGELIGSYSSTVAPDDNQIIKDIEEAIKDQI